jgi:hypothetical protein
MSIFVVAADDSSFGTWKVICWSFPPLGALAGATVTCAQAGSAVPVIASVTTPMTTATRRTIARSSSSARERAPTISRPFHDEDSDAAPKVPQRAKKRERADDNEREAAVSSRKR